MVAVCVEALVGWKTVGGTRGGADEGRGRLSWAAKGLRRADRGSMAA